ncbi:MAG TPA: type II toxin-antitoxin system RelE/ParE family toxin [bacterium]|nr:type II toxin-antitoxin system RelE/ParE family toxin [bacterium]
MTIVQSPYFRRSYKKLYASQLTAVNAAIKRVASEPSCGEEKKGDLAGVRVHKFRVQDQLHLLTYEHDGNTLYLLALGVHENFYRDLKKGR